MENDFDSSQFYQLDSQLHEVWFRTTHKELLWQTIQKSQVNYTRFRMLDIVAVQNYREIVAEHQELFEIIESKNKDAVESWVKKHMYGGIYRLGDRIHTEFKEYFQPENH